MGATKRLAEQCLALDPCWPRRIGNLSSGEATGERAVAGPGVAGGDVLAGVSAADKHDIVRQANRSGRDQDCRAKQPKKEPGKADQGDWLQAEGPADKQKLTVRSILEANPGLG